MPLLPTFSRASVTTGVLGGALRWIAWLVIAGASIVLAAWLILQWGILPRAERWKPELEAWATRTVGVPVQASRIEVAGSLWAPTLTLRDVRLLRQDGQPALQLASVRAVLVPRSLVPRSLVDWTPHFEQIVIDTPAVEVRRDRAGTVWVAGIALRNTANRDDSSPLADWLFRQREILLQHGDVRWVDEQRQAPPLHLRDVTLLLRNQVTRHRLRLDATPPEGWGERFTVRGDFRSPLLAITGLRGPGDWRRWRGQAQVALPLIDIEQLGSYVTLPWSLHQGRGRLSAWLDIDHNTLVGSSADVALRDVSLRTGKTAEPLEVDWLQTRLTFERQSTAKRSNARLALHQLRFQTADGTHWPATDLTLSVEQATEGDAVLGGSLEVSSLDLQRLAQLADHMPLPRLWHEELDSLRPVGQGERLRLQWEGALDDWRSYRASGTVRGLAWSSQPATAPDSLHRPPPGRPGVRNLDATFELDERKGQVALRMKDGELDLPGVFEESQIPITDLQTEVRWERELREGQRPGYTVSIPSLKLTNADLQASLQGRWQTGKGTAVHGRGGYLPGKLDLKARLLRTRLERVPRYLPLAIGDDTRHYLQHALIAGQVPQLTLQVSGDLADFPFEREQSGDFKLRATIEQARYAYVPPQEADTVHWPVFTQLRTELAIDRQRLMFINGSAKLGDSGEGRYGVSGVQGVIENYLHEPVLAIEGQGRGPLQDALHYVTHSPIDAWIGHALGQTQATGDGPLRLALRIPLLHSDRTTVRGTVQLEGNDLAMTPDTPLLAAARGRVDFSEKGFTVSQASARALGGALSFDGAQQPDGSVRFSGQGTVTAEGLRRASELPWLPPLARHMSGQTGYRLQLGFVKGQTELSVQSPLNGMGLRLPAPLGKNEADTLPLKVTLQPQPAVAGNAMDLLRVELGKLLDAQYLRRHAGSGTEATVQVVRGAVAVGQAPEWPATGVSAQIQWPTLSLDEWNDWSRRSEAETRTATGAPNAATPVAAERNDYLPSRWQLRTQQLKIDGRQLDKVRATASHEAGSPPARNESWSIDIEADQLAGRLELAGPGFGNGAPAASHLEDRVTARLTRLSIPRSEVSAIAEKLEQTETDLPSLDVTVDRFVLHGQPLGRLELLAANQPLARAGDARVWRIQKLLVSGAEAQLQASGQWVRRGGSNPSQTALDFKLDIRDAGQLLARFGMDKTVRNGRGLMNGVVRWRGAPLAFDWGTLGGHLHLEVERGQILRADAGAAKLLGLFNLQSLPRRLLLDFRDVTQSGFPFDRVDGDFGIENGVTTTRNLRVRGVQALILTEGQTDLVKETQDLHVWVVPEINAGAASLAYAVVNPAVGLGTLLGQLFLRRPLAEAATREYRVTGTWETPDIASIPRRQRTRQGAADDEGDGNAPAEAASEAATAAGPAASGTP